MQITSIQNIFKNNFQNKNNTRKLNQIHFQGYDSFELRKEAETDDVTVAKKYYRGNQELNPGLLLRQGRVLFIKGKDSYVPYSFETKEYNKKGELIKNTSYNNGIRYIVNTYKNGQIIQQNRYEDIYGPISQSSKRTSVVKFETPNGISKKPTVSFALGRNYGKKWQNSPSIIMRKNGKDDALFVDFTTPSETKNGKIEIIYDYKGKRATDFHSQIRDEKGYTLENIESQTTNEMVSIILEELKETIQDKEYRADFGSNKILISELNKAIEFLSSKLNAN